MTASATLVDQQIAAIMCGDPAALSAAVNLDELLAAARRHGVSALVSDRLRPTRRWPPSAQEILDRETALASALEALRQRELVHVLELLAQRGLHPLLLKGSALAHRLYADASHRARFDTDLLVRREDLDAVDDVMLSRGYSRARLVTGELVMHQVDYVRKDAQGIRHVYDFHWKLANRQAVADVLAFDELATSSVPIETLGPTVRGLGTVHALIHACVHRAAHHAGDERLIWLYDIHLLLNALTSSQVVQVVALASDRSVSTLCLSGVTAAQRCFGTSVPDGLRDGLNRPRRASEPSAALLQIHGAGFAELLADLRALPGWTSRARLVYEHAFPPPAYISGAYMTSNRIWLPALYTHRIVRGTWRWFRGPSR